MDLAQLLLLAGASLMAVSLVGSWWFRGLEGTVVRALVLRTNGHFETELLCVYQLEGRDVLVTSSEFVVGTEQTARYWALRYASGSKVRVHRNHDGTTSITGCEFNLSGTWAFFASLGITVGSLGWISGHHGGPVSFPAYVFAVAFCYCSGLLVRAICLWVRFATTTTAKYVLHSIARAKLPTPNRSAQRP